MSTCEAICLDSVPQLISLILKHLSKKKYVRRNFQTFFDFSHCQSSDLLQSFGFKG